MKAHLPKFLFRSALLAILGFPLATSFTGATDLANSPLANGLTSNTTVKPNIAFVVDDSGSMDYENMPDDDSDNKGSRCWGWNKYNTLAYDPSYTYKPPFKIDGTLYSDGVKRFPDASFADALKDGYFSSGGYTFGGSATSNSGVNLNTLSNLTPNGVTCQTRAQATITVSGDNSNTSVSQISVNGINIMSSASAANTSNSTVASNIAARITANGYSATASGGVVTILAPTSAKDVVATPFITISSGSKTFTPTSFGGYECPASGGKYYYSRHKTSTTANTCEADANYSIVTDASQIVAPTGVDAKTNYANWYSYYRKRAYLMKAAAGEAFKDLDESKYRVGLFFINSIESGATIQVTNPTSHRNNDFKIADFSGAATGTQRYDWFSKLYASRKDGSTPLRGALSRMGRMYAGKISGWDPVQYSCQQNFTILSTDGFWNTGAESSTYGPKKLNGTDDVGDADGAAKEGVPAKATITVNTNSGNGIVAQITVGGVNLMASPSVASTDRSVVASNVAAKITLNGFSASASGRVITITAPLSLIGLTETPSVTAGTGNNKTYATTAFAGSVDATTGAPLPYKDAFNQANTLADVAYYYYQTPLRSDALGNCSNTIGGTTYTNLCDNNVRGSGKDLNSKQHMTSFTIGLGVSGTIKYESDYESAAKDADASTNQYYDVVNGTVNWPTVTVNSDSDRNKIDDLWHAAVNGRGNYYSAVNANSLKEGIQSALRGVDIRKGSSAAAATSNLQPVAGDNFAYVALYQTIKWDGDLQAFTIDPSTGDVSGSAIWSAQARIDAQVAAAGASTDGRVIKYFSSGEVGKLKDFTYANLTADGLQSYFDNICSKTPLISQCGTTVPNLSAAQVIVANNGGNLVNYLRGRSTYEWETSNTNLDNRIYRGRDHVLGDVVNAVPSFVKKPPFAYDYFDATYGLFKSTNSNRVPNVYVAANDGMLHALNAGNATGVSDGNEGQERWAYVPRLVMPNLWHLADTNYGNDHRYSVDGSPVVADICDSLSSDDVKLCASESHWKTILVAGLNKGGCGYYALDVTNPTSPQGLWEFTNPNLGYSFGNPIITKNKNGRWVVIVSSGYNNSSGCAASGDGNGHVFVLDAATGELLDDIPTYTSGTTAAGSTGSPSGLGQLNAWVDNSRLGVADRVYGGDMQGNLWRIDFDDNHLPAGKEAVLIASLKDGAATPNAQPISVRPELAEIDVAGTKYPLIMVGTGRYLGDSDISDLSQQTIYGIKDTLASVTPINVRGGSLKSRTLVETNGSSGGALDGRVIRTLTGDTLDWNADNGWYFDFNPNGVSAGERINVQMSLDSSTLTLATNVPSPNACTVGGYALRYSVNIYNGKAVANTVDGAVGVRLGGNALVAGIRMVTLSSGKKVVVITDTSGGIVSDTLPSTGDGAVGAARRTAWREIID
jgi:type IV pilus assembly protein PilY1